ncbi:ead/Ea22-like family protein [Salmonella enterica subsp. enterica serovar Senftenberg]|uniref:Ead/Ea22-like family protein n=1 Tax=Salmonella enterica subsp. enterica serovar Kalamu TaxID=2564590 RepID=A0A5V8XZF2_SALET|nr:ead/Ea22-like family protein [Salmonella enterica subsp. enterica serovar Senftenberg]EAC0498181.1 ead/Ea22-like family protein [Salmonella enterica subsp. enterica serovar Give]EAW0779730.1 ead/Ea22-like family protein [Salmonella enterica]EBH8551194.1 ead/Ea22-like family protein [Salmonella enterica subsp. enterica serovar Weltevreden]EBU8262257.1 Eae protein [Salmonella enterica subsp. enterica serovar Stuttgart]EBV4909825.1 ead/Ea22-like family protein [Salmonella enterica subsp. enter
MKEVKIYTIVSDQLSPPITGESFCTDMVRHSDYADLEEKCAALAAENAGLKELIEQHANSVAVCPNCSHEEPSETDDIVALYRSMETPATDAFLAEVRAKTHKEGAYFVANRMLAALDAGFIDDTAKNAADIARMILTSTEFMADAPEGDFDRSFADGVLEGIAAQLRKGVQS